MASKTKAVKRLSIETGQSAGQAPQCFVVKQHNQGQKSCSVHGSELE
jgi:hypothetical protein